MKEEILFKEALREKNLMKLKKVPKSDLHNHSLLGMRFDTFKKIVKKELPYPEVRDLTSLNDFIFNKILPCIKSSFIFCSLIEATINEAILDGVKILESSIDLNSIRFFQDVDDFLNSIKKIKDKFRSEIDFRPELGIQKSIEQSKIDKFLPILIDSNLFYSIDLYGDEKITDFERFTDCFNYAKKRGLKTKIHIGEFCEPEIVKKAIKILNPDKIQHGITATQDDYLIEMIKEMNIRLNICPTSNVVLGATKDYTSHPIKKLFLKGVKVTINSDDLLIFNSNVTEEFLILFENNVLGADELNEIRLIGLMYR